MSKDLVERLLLLEKWLSREFPASGALVKEAADALASQQARIEAEAPTISTDEHMGALLAGAEYDLERGMEAERYEPTAAPDNESATAQACCCAIHHQNYGRCLQCPVHGLEPPAPYRAAER